jgi:autotransporter-associated beta strand protein
VAIQYAYASNVAAGNLTLSGGITLDSTSTLDAVRSGGLIDVTSAITGAGGLNIASSASSGGVVQLSAANTYTGATTISAGTLKLTGAGNTGSGAVSLGTVGTLDVSEKAGGHTIGTLIGSGSVTGNLTVSTELAIGNSPGTVTFNNGLTLANDATYTYELTGGVTPGSADLANVTGALNITGAILDLVQLGTYTANNKFTLFAYSGGLTGTFKDAVGTNLLDGASFTDAGGLWTIDYDDGTAGSNGGTGSQFVTITAIPEPDVAMLLGGLGMLTLLRRRRA